MRSVLFDLPEVLQVRVYCSWITIVDVGFLDVAVCEAASRPSFHSTLGHAVYVAKGLGHLIHRVAFLKWSIQRCIRFDGISITEALTDDAEQLSSFLFLSGSTVRWLDFYNFNCRDRIAVATQISQQCKEIRKLTIHGDDKFVTVLLGQISRANPHLEEIVCKGEISPNVLHAIGLLPALKTLVVQHLGAKNVISDVVAVPTLEVLDVPSCFLTESAQFAIAQRCPKLRVLRIFDRHRARHPCGVTDAGLRAILQGCSMLCETDVEYAVGLSRELRLELVRRCRITEINMNEWGGVDPGLMVDICKVCPSLQKIVQGCVYLCGSRRACLENATDRMLITLGEHCPLLAVLHIPCAQYITLDGLRALVKPGNRLSSIHLTSARLDDQAVLLIAEHCPLLEEFTCPSQTTDVGVIALAERCPNLSLLCLGSTSVTYQGLAALAQYSKKLKFLDLDCFDDVTDESVRVLEGRGVQCNAELNVVNGQLVVRQRGRSQY
jgi:hypothetical protein